MEIRRQGHDHEGYHECDERKWRSRDNIGRYLHNASSTGLSIKLILIFHTYAHCCAISRKGGHARRRKLIVSWPGDPSQLCVRVRLVVEYQPHVKRQMLTMSDAGRPSPSQADSTDSSTQTNISFGPRNAYFSRLLPFLGPLKFMSWNKTSLRISPSSKYVPLGFWKLNEKVSVLVVHSCRSRSTIVPTGDVWHAC